MFIFLTSVAAASYVLTEFARAPTGALHVYKPTVWPVASCSLYFDIQAMTLLLGEFNYLAHANLHYTTTRPPSYLFQQYL